jgi:hypothetical protein
MVQEELKCILLCTVSSMRSTNEASRQGVRTLLKFSSFDDGTPKENTLRHTNQEKNQVLKPMI